MMLNNFSFEITGRKGSHVRFQNNSRRKDRDCCSHAQGLAKVNIDEFSKHL